MFKMLINWSHKLLNNFQVFKYKLIKVITYMNKSHNKFEINYIILYNHLYFMLIII